MREIDDIKRMLSPLMRGLPLIIFSMCAVGFVVNKMLNYVAPKYETELRLKIDNKDYSFTRNNLYKDFDVLTATDKVLTEVEVIKSDLIIEDALVAMHLPVSYYRVGSLITSEIYPVAPFVIEEVKGFELKPDHRYSLEIFDQVKLAIQNGIQIIDGNIGDTLEIGNGKCIVKLNDEWLKEFGESELQGLYQFKVNTIRGLKADFVTDHLLVNAIDKDIDIIRIHFEGENAQKTADFTNQLAQSFIDDYIKTKVQAAHLTSNFIDTQVTNIKEKLIDAELKLEKYRNDKNILNTKQEVEVGLKKIAELDVQLSNLNLKKITMDSLILYVERESDNYQHFAPSFEAYGGLLFVELIKKYQALLEERQMLSSEYTAQSKELKDVNFKLTQTKNYIKQSIFNHQELVKYQYQLLEKRLQEEKERYLDVPSKERNYVTFQRDFDHYEDLYNFLMKKKMEADIAKTVDLSFHKIIKKAVVATKPASPNKKFLTALSVLCVFFILTFLVYMVDYFRSSIRSKYKLEQFIDEPVRLFLSRDNTKDKLVNSSAFVSLVENNFDTPQVIALASGNSGEGKTFFLKNLLESLKDKNLKIKVVTDTPFENTSVDFASYSDLSVWRRNGYKKSELLGDNDLVVLETIGVKFSNEEANLLSKMDQIFFIVRNGYSKWQHVSFLRTLIKNEGLTQYNYIFNDYSPFSNYQGHVSTDNRYKGSKNGVFNLIRYFWRMYKALWTS